MATIYSLPSLGVNEGELIWCNADHWTVLFVKMLQMEDEVAFECIIDVHNATGCPELGSRKVAEWVKRNIVETSGKKAQNYLVCQYSDGGFRKTLSTRTITREYLKSYDISRLAILSTSQSRYQGKLVADEEAEEGQDRSWELRSIIKPFAFPTALMLMVR